MTEVKHGHGLVWAAALLACLLGACSSQESKVLPPVALAETRCPAESKMVMASTNDYGRSFIARLSKQLSYPTEALAEGQIGDVHLCVRVSRDGAIQEGRVLLGSGYPALDGAALQALGVLRQSKESAPVPKDVGSGKEVWLALTVRFDPDNAGLQQGHSAPDDRPCKITGTDEGDAGMQKLSMREWGEFPRRFSEAVRGHLIYPASAAGMRGGATLLCVALDRNGRLLGATVSRSSGSFALDGAALSALGAMILKGEVPPLPDSIREDNDSAVFTQEIDWSLK